MNIPDPNKPTERLFHAVNKMFRHEGYIFHFNPSKSQCAREIVAGLLVFLQGTWKPLLAPEKFKKFFTSSAIERAMDTWWDPTECCVVTKVDTELEDLPNQDTDLMFYEEDMEIDLTGINEEETEAKDVGMSTGSISTFQTAATKKQNTEGYIPPTKNHNSQTRSSICYNGYVDVRV